MLYFCCEILTYIYSSCSESFVLLHSYLFIYLINIIIIIIFFLQGTSTEIKCECLDILCDVLHKFGNLMATDHEILLNALLLQLSSNHASVRKKTVSCIGKMN